MKTSDIAFFALVGFVFLMLFIMVLISEKRDKARWPSPPSGQESRDPVVVVAASVPQRVPPSTGLSSSQIAALPSLPYRMPSRTRRRDGWGGSSDDDTEEGEECSICSKLLEEGEIVRALPNCVHMFHVECIDSWLGNDWRCPSCKRDARPTLISSAVAPVEMAGRRRPPPAAQLPPV